ncbi:MAG: hypothetical protein PUC27_01360 [Clostridium sp.]|nr:hypothetical protein [Clostridium sp.]
MISLKSKKRIKSINHLSGIIVFAICVCCIFASLSMIGCAGGGSSVKSTPEPAITISTKFGDLYFPAKWEGLLRTEQEESDESVIVTFKAVVREQELTLFVVTIGRSGDTMVGRLKDAGGTERSVYLYVEELSFGEGITADEQHSLYAMQEDLNYLIDRLNSDK